MSHRFQKSVADYALGMVPMMMSRISEHMHEHNGAKPKVIVLHTASYVAWKREMDNKYGGPEPVMMESGMRGPGIFGVLVANCPKEGCLQGDYYLDAQDVKQDL